MTIDRFNSNEEVGWHREAMSEGRLARMDNFALTDNPYIDKNGTLPENWIAKSWRAGYVEMDMEILINGEKFWLKEKGV